MTAVEQLAMQIRDGQDPDGQKMLALLAKLEGITVIVSRPYRQYIELAELLSLSFFAASEAVKSWDPERAGFITIFKYNLLTELSAAAATEGTSVYIPSHMRSRIRAYRQFVGQYQATHGGREPDDTCICASLRITDKDLQSIKLASMAMTPDSIDRPLTDDGDETMLTLGDTLPAAADEPEDITDRLYQQQLAQAFSQALESLPNEERTTILLLYSESLTRAEIASKMNVPVQEVRRRQRHALQRLRDQWRGLSGFLEEANTVKHTGYQSWAHSGQSQPERLVMQFEADSRPWRGQS